MKPASELTPAEAAEWSATKVMGWTFVSNKEVEWFEGRTGVRHAKGWDTPSGFVERYQFSPLEDANDALAMLEAWCGAAPGRWPCLTMGSDAGIWTVVLVEGTWQVSATDTFMTAAFAAVYAAVEGND